MARILLLEPNTLLAATYTQAFTFSGHTVEHVVDGQAAVYVADGRRPDVVVLELQLPNHNGIEFLHEFRSYPDWQAIPVIVHTALTPAKTTPAAHVLQRELGVHSILYKPQTSLTALLRAVAAAVEQM